MSEKQLNFIDIFKTPGEEQQALSSADPAPADEVLSDDYADLPTTDLNAASVPTEIETVYAVEPDAKEIESRRRQQLLYSPLSCSPDDFSIVLPEIREYADRLRSYQVYYQNASSDEKAALYPRLVWPENYDEPEYRESARLYLNYLEAVKRTREVKQKEEKAAALALKKSKKNKKADKKNPTKISKTLPFIGISVQNKNRSGDDNRDGNDHPDPYGEIYPFSRRR